MQIFKSHQSPTELPSKPQQDVNSRELILSAPLVDSAEQPHEERLYITPYDELVDDGRLRVVNVLPRAPL